MGNVTEPAFNFNDLKNPFVKYINLTFFTKTVGGICNTWIQIDEFGCEHLIINYNGIIYDIGVILETSEIDHNTSLFKTKTKIIKSYTYLYKKERNPYTLEFN